MRKKSQFAQEKNPETDFTGGNTGKPLQEVTEETEEYIPISGVTNPKDREENAGLGFIQALEKNPETDFTGGNRGNRGYIPVSGVKDPKDRDENAGLDFTQALEKNPETDFTGGNTGKPLQEKTE